MMVVEQSGRQGRIATVVVRLDRRRMHGRNGTINASDELLVRVAVLVTRRHRFEGSFTLLVAIQIANNQEKKCERISFKSIKM